MSRVSSFFPGLTVDLDTYFFPAPVLPIMPTFSPALNLECEMAKDQWQIIPVSELDVVELHQTLEGPSIGFWIGGKGRRCFNRQVVVELNSFDVVLVQSALYQGSLSNVPSPAPSWQRVRPAERTLRKISRGHSWSDCTSYLTHPTQLAESM